MYAGVDLVQNMVFLFIYINAMGQFSFFLREAQWPLFNTSMILLWPSLNGYSWAQHILFSAVPPSDINNIQVKPKAYM